jgi:hyperosmotically inducible periplasmic protein
MRAGGVVPPSGELRGSWGTVSQLKEKVMKYTEKVMKYTRALAIALLAGATIVSTGCAVIRGQETVGAYVDDTAITTAVKAKFVEDKSVDAGAIKVQTLNGTVQLSGFAKSNQEKAQAELIARNTKGVRSVVNSLTVRP